MLSHFILQFRSIGAAKTLISVKKKKIKAKQFYQSNGKLFRITFLLNQVIRNFQATSEQIHSEKLTHTTSFVKVLIHPGDLEVIKLYLGQLDMFSCHLSSKKPDYQ